MVRVEQRNDNDCMVACLAMVLAKPYEEVVRWFGSKRRDWHVVSDVVLTLIEHGYAICFLDGNGLGFWGNLRRLVGTLEQRRGPSLTGNAQQFGHAFVIDENEKVHDPDPKSPAPLDMKALLGRLADLGHKVDWVALIESLPNQPEVLTEDITEDGFHILRDKKLDMLLQSHYAIYNKQCFNNSLPFVPVRWAKSITLPDGSRANGVYVPGDSLVKQRYIAVDEKLSGMFPLERLCLLHEMVHVKIGPDCGHGEEFIAEFSRVLDANKWEVMGCIDTLPEEPSLSS